MTVAAVARKWDSIAYWEDRANDRMLSYLRDANEQAKTIYKAFQYSERLLYDQMKAIQNKYMKDYGLTREEALERLSSPITQAQYYQLLDQVKNVTDPEARRALHGQIASRAYAYRADQKKLLRDAILVQTQRLAALQESVVERGLLNTAMDAYWRSMYDLQRGIGIGFSFKPINDRAIRVILDNPWSGKVFSERIWSNLDKLNSDLSETLTSGFLTGRSIAKMSTELSERMGVEYRQAERLIRTEYNYVAGQSELMAYKEAGVERYQFLATLDHITSKICQELDGQIFYLKDARVGENMHPMHPHCRSTHIAVLDDHVVDGLMRRAKGKDGGYITVPRSMTYSDWKRVHGK